MSNQILILGQGNIGTFIGAALTAAGNNITHLIRPTHVMRESVKLTINDRRATRQKIKKGQTYRYVTTTDYQQINHFDVIIISVGHRQWRHAIETINPYLTGKHTLVLAGNVWDDFDWFEKNIRSPFLFAFPNFGGAIMNNQLKGWLTSMLTIGITQSAYSHQQKIILDLLAKAGFTPRVETDIKGWLMTHFAYNAGMLAEAAYQNGFQHMTRSWGSLINMYKLIRECMEVVNRLGVTTIHFKEAREANHALWWNALKSYLLFLLPGLAKSADETKNIEEWYSYAKKVKQTANDHFINTPLLSRYEIKWQ